MTSPTALHDPSETRILRGPVDGHKLSKATANYVDDAGTEYKSCAVCRFHSGGSCRLVEGTILPGGLSDLYQPVVLAAPGQMTYYHDLASFGDGTVVPILELPVPVEFKEGKQKPEWIPYLPKPGSFKHPKFGTVVLTAERNANFVSQFKAGVYQDRLPIDAEHQPITSGALGWITELRLNTDGSVDAKATWTSRGETMLADNRFPYFSPAFFDSWPDPVDGKVHKDVAIGGALTTRPYFKPQAGLRPVRPLVSAAEGLYFGTNEFTTPEGPTRFSDMQFAVLERDEREEDPVTVPQPAAAPAATTNGTAPAAAGAAATTEATVTLKDGQIVMSKSDADELAALRAAAKPAAGAAAQPSVVTASETEVKLTAMQATIDTQATALRTASERLEDMARQTRQRDFAEIVEGRAGNKPWVGPRENHLRMLEMLFGADPAGTEGQVFKDYVADQNGIAETMSRSQSFRDVGSTAAARVVSTSAEGEMNAALRTYKEANPTLDDAAAMEKLFSERPELYDAYLEEHRSKGQGR